MANSIITVEGDGVTTQYALNFTLGNLRREYVTCRVGDEVDGLGDPVYRTLEWITDGLVNIQGTVPGDGVAIVFKRTMPKDALIHDYTDGVPIIEENLDESNLQNLMAIHEFLDGRLEGGFVQDIDMNGYRIVNMGEGVDEDDAVTLGQASAIIASLEDIETVADNIADVVAVADIDADVTTVAGIAADVTTVAGISADVSSVAAIDTDVSSVAAIDTDVSTAAANIAAIIAAPAEAAAAAASAVEAANYAAALKATSTTSLAIGTGGKAFTTQAGKQFAAGQWIVASSDADPTNYMHGYISSYSGTSLVMVATNVGGSGTLADWTIQVSGTRGTNGTNGIAPIADGAGTVDAITANFTPDITLADKTLVCVISTGANTVTNPTFAPDGLTARTIVTNGGAALVAGDTGAAGFPMLLEYNLANTRWELLNPSRVVTAFAKTLLDDPDAATARATLGVVSSPIVAWCTFNGTTTGTNAPAAGSNVTSVTRNGTGDYTVNFTNALADTLYGVSGYCRRNNATVRPVVISGGNSATYNRATGSFRFISFCEAAASAEDSLEVHIMFYR